MSPGINGQMLTLVQDMQLEIFLISVKTTTRVLSTSIGRLMQICHTEYSESLSILYDVLLKLHQDGGIQRYCLLLLYLLIWQVKIPHRQPPSPLPFHRTIVLWYSPHLQIHFWQLSMHDCHCSPVLCMKSPSYSLKKTKQQVIFSIDNSDCKLHCNKASKVGNPTCHSHTNTWIKRVTCGSRFNR